ncbi:hypothetical protein F2P56_034366 [Juglans regia]|uniref:VAL1-3 N-terminal zinc finger domain-containing protein n=1 Tax=Juglans regia TaxID=51240 RepID=A0A833SP84_JUGRE|nr:hypothetical protein F2P56_034366 [Juglans regia]
MHDHVDNLRIIFESRDPNSMILKRCGVHLLYKQHEQSAKDHAINIDVHLNAPIEDIGNLANPMGGNQLSKRHRVDYDDYEDDHNIESNFAKTPYTHFFPSPLSLSPSSVLHLSLNLYSSRLHAAATARRRRPTIHLHHRRPTQPSPSLTDSLSPADLPLSSPSKSFLSWVPSDAASPPATGIATQRSPTPPQALPISQRRSALPRKDLAQAPRTSPAPPSSTTKHHRKSALYTAAMPPHAPPPPLQRHKPTQNRQVHCGCIVSIHTFSFLDRGGIECMKCARKSVLWRLLIPIGMLMLQ